MMQDTRGESLEEAMQRGIAASEAGEKEEAHRIFQEISSRFPEAMEVWIWLGWNSTSLDESDAAFQRAYALDPNSEEARLGLRYVNSQRASQQEQPQAAAPQFITGDTDTQGNINFMLNVEEQMQVGIAAIQTGDKAAAYSTFRQIVAAEPGLAEAWVWLGGTTTDMGEAESAFRRALEFEPDNEEARLGLRWVGLRKQVLQQPSPEDMPQVKTEPVQEPAPLYAGFFKPYDTGELLRRGETPVEPEKKSGLFGRLFGKRK
jgi:tetratricopeptide (TPR) repeat protein